ncbi:MAG TPA: glycosyltransferase family 2 protein [Gaiellaceae bacterium]|jgi:GT2 family glycosyltransferase
MQGEAAPLDVEVSLVNTNNRELLRACLASLPEAAGTLTWHATVVDNASDDGSPEVVRLEFPWARLIENMHRLGFSANHNQVIGEVVSHDSARYVLVLNEDTELQPGALEELVLFADREDRLGAAGPRLVEKDGQEQTSYFGFPAVLEQFWSTLRPGQPPRRAETTGWLNGSCLLVRTDALRRVGPLDARFFIFFEDTDLGLRLHRGGWRSAVCESSTVVHHGHQTVSDSSVGTHMERQMLRSRYLYFRKHHGRQTAGVVVALVRMALGVRAAKALLTGSITRDGGERMLAGLLWGLARYDPVAPLPHESLAPGVSS